VLIHPDTAADLGISDETEVRIVTAAGSVTQKARFSEDLCPEVVMADFGWWFPEKSEDTFEWEESNINCAIGSEGPKDPVLGTIQLRGIPCRLEKISR
jgi:anaerobic selenocysteine-containing dehydrogenase